MKYRIEKGDAFCTVYMTGALDDQVATELNEMRTHLPEVGIIFNCREITRISTSGARAFENFLTSILSGRSYSFEQCSSKIVEYFNLFPKLKGNGTVVSVLVPYECNHCGAKTEVMMAGNQMDVRKGFNAVKCEKCGNLSQATVSVEDFFSFMSD